MSSDQNNMQGQFQEITALQEKTDNFVPPKTTPTADSIIVEDVWKILYEKLRINISERDLKIWYKGVYLEKIENGVAQLSCDNSMKREWIENNHRAFLRNKIEEIIGYKPDLLFNIRAATKEESADKYQYESPAQGDQPSLFAPATQQQDSYKFASSTVNSNLNPKYIKDNFIVGANNQLAYAVAEGVIADPGKAYNPVFFYGPSGVGKTHLMQAIGNAMKVQDPNTHIVYVPIETFLNEMIESIRTGNKDDFRQKYRAADLLIIDDIQFISTYKKTQEELFNTFNALYQDNKQIVIASDRPPREIENLPDRLRTRFEGGMVVDMQMPDLETRIAILRQRMEEYKTTIPDNLVVFIAQNMESSVRELEGAITKVITQQKFSQTPLTEEDVAKMLQVDIDTKRRRIKPDTIVDAVCEIFDVTRQEVKGKRRTAHVALSRQVIMYLLREELEYPLEKVAKEVNRKDHTTVLHACEKISGMLVSDERFKGRLDKCRALYIA